jgi:hypothetical protein
LRIETKRFFCEGTNVVAKGFLKNIYKNLKEEALNGGNAFPSYCEEFSYLENLWDVKFS